jgi:hypothetical protein
MIQFASMDKQCVVHRLSGKAIMSNSRWASPFEARMRQQKVRAAYSSFVHLSALLDQGWQIEPPIYVRPRWRARALHAYNQAEREHTYHFVLRHGEKFSLVSVFDCPEVQQLLESEELTVDRL